MSSSPAKQPLHLEDIAVGDRFESASHEMTEERILAFAREFDPQPFHTDPQAATETFFEGLAASGWHTAAVVMKLLVASIPVAGGLIGAGSEVSWPRATRPGDRLRVVSTIKEIIPSRSKPDRGIVLVESLALNQDDQVCQRSVARVLMFRRDAQRFDAALQPDFAKE
ncbi:MaoC family dehydratase [Pseudomonas sp. Marseille-QA0332]